MANANLEDSQGSVKLGRRSDEHLPNVCSESERKKPVDELSGVKGENLEMSKQTQLLIHESFCMAKFVVIPQQLLPEIKNIIIYL